MWQNSKNFLREGNIPSSGKPLNRKVNISQTRPQTGSPWQTKVQIPPKSNFVVLLGLVTEIMVGVTYKIKNGPKMAASPKGHSVMGDSLQSWELVAERIACRRKTGWRILFFSTRLWCKSLPCILLKAVVSQQLVWSQNPLWGFFFFFCSSQSSCYLSDISPATLHLPSDQASHRIDCLLWKEGA